MNSISIVILNYNTSVFTKNCLNSILKYNNALLEIIVVDNNSSDRSITLLEKEFPTVKFFFKEINDGFACGCNFGASKSSGKYLLFLNPDVIIKDDIFSRLSEYMEGNEKAGIISGVMYDDDNTVQYFYNDFPDIAWEISMLYMPLIEKKIEKLNSKEEIYSKKNFLAGWFHGAFLFIRKNDFDSIGGFNENYFMYYEDVELCFKVKNLLDKNIICLPEIRYFHSKKSSLAGEKSDDLYTFHINRSKLLFISNYSFFKRSGIFFTGLMNVFSRLLILPFWNKYKDRKRLKLKQLLKILKLYFSKAYLKQSKNEFIR